MLWSQGQQLWYSITTIQYDYQEAIIIIIIMCGHKYDMKTIQAHKNSL